MQEHIQWDPDQTLWQVPSEDITDKDKEIPFSWESTCEEPLSLHCQAFGVGEDSSMSNRHFSLRRVILAGSRAAIWAWQYAVQWVLCAEKALLSTCWIQGEKQQSSPPFRWHQQAGLISVSRTAFFQPWAVRVLWQSKHAVTSYLLQQQGREEHTKRKSWTSPYHIPHWTMERAISDTMPAYGMTALRRINRVFSGFTPGWFKTNSKGMTCKMELARVMFTLLQCSEDPSKFRAHSVKPIEGERVLREQGSCLVSILWSALTSCGSLSSFASCAPVLQGI